MTNFTFQTLLSREMDRKEFLLILGVLMLTITGIAGVLESVKKISGSPLKSTDGFGSGPYGQ